MRGRGWVLASATVDHTARLPFCTKDFSRYLPIRRVRSGHGSVVRWVSYLLYFRWEIFENTCSHRVNELTEAYASYVASEFVSLGVSY